jgi:hypothetical protein
MTDEFAERFFPVHGREFLARSGIWRCELNGPVNVSGVDRRVFYLRFVLVKPDPRWKGAPAKERKLELRTSLATFHNLDGRGVGYAGWLALVIEGFLDSDKTEDVIEAYEIERG